MGLHAVDYGRLRSGMVVRVGAGALAAASLLFGCAAESVDDGGGSAGMAPVAGMFAGAGGTAGGTAGMVGGAGVGSQVGGGEIPCEVKTLINTHCGTCHGAVPIGGAPMPLLTVADFQADYTARSTVQLVGQSMKMHELVKIRMNQLQGTAIMPQGAPLAAADLATVNAWLDGGAQPGAACGGGGAGGVAGGDVNPMGGAGGVGGVVNPMAGTGGAGTGGGGVTDLCDAAEAYEPLVARDGETCYDFLTHNGDGVSPFMIQTNESYNQLYYALPWPAGSIATRFGADFDNLQVLHHWLGFLTTESRPPNTVLRNVTGSVGGLLGGGHDSKLIGGWAVGGCNVEFPSEMGLELADPGSGRMFMVQWHHYNFTPTAQPDSSKVQICTVPRNARPNVGGLTWLGTENFNGPFGMPPGVESKFSGTCLNKTQSPITIVAFWPHMHEIGTHMYTEVIRTSGAIDRVFDLPFTFDNQVHYDLDPFVVINPGEKVRAECTFFNNTSANVAFGQSTGQEMCYQFAFSYPAGALDKPANPSLIGANNTCWGD